MCFTKYYRNFILCGDINQHCLLCNENFVGFNETDKHIRWEKHRKDLKTQTCLRQLKNDGIYKISSYYYCQYCNLVSYDMASIKEHITTQKHASNKITPDANVDRVTATCDDDKNIIIDKFKIDRVSWNGIFEERCLLCDTKVKNLEKHFNSQDHVIRLIQSKAKYEEDKCYRKVNETLFQCFYCMKPCLSEDYEKHWEDHKVDISGNFEKPTRIYCWKEYKKILKLEFDICQLENITDEFFTIDLKKKQIKCKQCNKIVKPSKTNLSNHMYVKHSNLNTDKSHILKKIKEEIDKRYSFTLEQKDAGKTRHELAMFSKDNHIKLNAAAKKGYCFMCDRYLFPHIDIFQEHVQGILHTSHLEYKGLIKARKHEKPATLTHPFVHQIDTLDFVIYLDAICVNFDCCIDKQSFLLMKRIKHGKHLRVTKCLVCEESFPWWQEKEHCETDVHKSYFMDARVVIVPCNFIREIKPKLYHCGLCNVTLPFWETLYKHVKERSHKNNVAHMNLVYSVKTYHEKHGKLPEGIVIDTDDIHNALYSNILKVLFQSRLGDLRIYSIDLNKGQKSTEQVTTKT